MLLQVAMFAVPAIPLPPQPLGAQHIASQTNDLQPVPRMDGATFFKKRDTGYHRTTLRDQQGRPQLLRQTLQRKGQSRILRNSHTTLR